MSYHRILCKVFQECGNDGNDDEGWKYHTQGCQNPAQNAFILVTNEGRGIHRDNARSTLADGKIVGEFLFRGPALLFYNLPLEDGQHGIATAKGTDTDFRKG